MNRSLFLDANAGTPPVPQAREALVGALDVTGNPSSPHQLGRKARRVLDEARDAVATALGGLSKEVVFTSGASEANRFLVDSIVATGRQRGARLHVASSPLEHPSLHKALARAADEGTIAWTVLPVSATGVVDASAIAADVDVVCVTAAHNETGLLPGLDAVAAALRDNVVLIADAAQAVARLPVLPARVDAVVASAHKIGGVAGSGAVLLRNRAKALAPPWTGGGQEGGLRPGTEALSLIAAFGAAAAVVDDTRARHGALAPVRDALEAALVGAWGAVPLLGERLPNTTALVVPDVDGEALRIAIDQTGVCVGFGSACSALAPEPSSSLMALGLSATAARATVRLSLAPQTPRADVDEALARLLPVVPTLRARRR